MEQRATEVYKRSFNDSIGSGIGALTGSDKQFYILEHRTPSKYHHAGESQKIILNQIEIGRDPRCQIRYDDSFTTVSRHHAAIVRDGNGWKLINLSKVNQTLLNGQEVHEQWYLENGDEIQLSVNGPRLGFIIPQGEKSMIKNINFTERFALFREQVLRPYRQLVTIMIIAFLIVIGGFLAWAVLEHKRNDQFAKETLAQSEILKKGVDDTSLKLEDTVQKLDDANQKIEETNQITDEIKIRQDELNRLNEELKEQQQKLTELLRSTAAVSGSKTSQSLMEIRNEIQENQKKIETEIAKIEKNIETKATVDTVKTVSGTSTTKVITTETTPETSTAKVITTEIATKNDDKPSSPYNVCLPYIYYIQLSKIEIIDTKGNITTYNTTKIRWAGTGFLLNNRRFITSRRVLEKWRFKENVSMQDLNKSVENGHRVVAYFTAYSSSGAAFSFTNEQFTYDKTGDLYDSRTKMHFAPSAGNKDWAYFNIQQDANALKFNDNKSENMDRGVNLTILGFPKETGYNSGLGPMFGSAVTASNGVDKGIIQAINTNFEAGGLGAPVFAATSSGELEVVGLVSLIQLSSQRCIVVPISAVK